MSDAGNGRNSRVSRSVSSDSGKSHSRSRSRGSRSRGKRSRSRSGSRSKRRSHHKSSHRRRSRSRSRSRGRHGSGARHGSRTGSHSPMSGRRRHMGDRERPQECKCLGVFGLSLNTDDRDLHEIFGKYGPIDSANVVYDKHSGRSRGFGFVYFRDIADAVDAKQECAGIEVDGRTIRVDYSITQRAHTPTPGVYLGRPTQGGYRDGPRRRSPEPYGRNSYRSRSPSF